jgi:hypothetical protein
LLISLHSNGAPTAFPVYYEARQTETFVGKLEAWMVSPGEAAFSEAIRETLAAPAARRAAIFEQLARDIETKVGETCPQYPWTCHVYDGVDGSRIFRGGVGASLVIDPEGRLWRARNYEDFATTYRIEGNTCQIETLRPLYSQMRQYQPR